MKWNVSAGCDSIRIEFPLSNPWYASQTVTQVIAPDSTWTSLATVYNGDFTYRIIRFKVATVSDTIQATIGWVDPAKSPVPSLSTWAVLILVLAVIAVSIALLRKRIRVGA
jgi:hypothetical protein